MLIFAVSGFSKTGKSSVVESLVAFFSAQGRSVATIKDSACDSVRVRNGKAKDTDRHLNAGAKASVLLSTSFTSIQAKRRFRLSEALALLNKRYDTIILEGFKSLDMPKIVTAETMEDADENYRTKTFAFSGKLAQKFRTYRGLPVFNCMLENEVEKMAHLAAQNALSDIKDIVGTCGDIY